MKNLTLEHIAEACGGIYRGTEEQKKEEVTCIFTDSRKAEKGGLFVPRKGFGRAALSLYSGEVFPYRSERHCRILSETAFHPRCGNYGKRGKDQHKGNDCSRSFSEIQYTEDPGEF